MSDEDYAGGKSLPIGLGEKVQLVGDDLFVTNVKRLSEGIEKGNRKCDFNKTEPDRYLI